MLGGSSLHSGRIEGEFAHSLTEVPRGGQLTRSCEMEMALAIFHQPF